MLLWLSVGWVFASAVVAMLPMRLQYVPGVALLGAAPLLMVWIALEFGLWAVVPAALAVASMYRNPLRYFWTRLSRQKVETT